eukprot:TRINITY_DN1989_c0_g1_i1.p2 TRINITY_DN1989_c0_g1~~TRINITY_DN1989_c0_g1_i1.p2  ORF type:complete len:52 (+),score=12.11 TRINITY_DN1989_c0_g1_i1:735-890(+)
MKDESTPSDLLKAFLETLYIRKKLDEIGTMKFCDLTNVGKTFLAKRSIQGQ